MSDLTKDEALKILTLVLDDEASPREESAFLNYIEHDPEMNAHYRSLLSVKKALKEKYQKQDAPSSLRYFVVNKIYTDKVLSSEYSAKQGSSSNNKSENTDGISGKIKTRQNITAYFRYISAAAAILFFSILIFELLDRSGIPGENIQYQLEEYAYNHFENHNGSFIEPTFRTASLTTAENYLNEFHSLKMTVPPVRSADFSGIVVSDFIPGYQTPLFEYYQEELNQYIYIFAFYIPDLENVKNLVRDSIAIESINSDTDFHVTEISGKHVVSWQWDDNWYAAVSNHNGYELASIIEPLNYTAE